MRPLSAIILALLALSLTLRAADDQGGRKNSGHDALLFRNGDFVYGSLLGMDDDTGVQLLRSDAPQPLVFTRGSITEIQLAPRSAPATNGPNQCVVRLVNEDQLDGALVSFDGAKLVLDTWYAGKLSIPASWISMILPLSPQSKIVFEGPSGLDGWTMGKVNNAVILDSGEWIYKNGAFYAGKSASIARDVKLPDSASLSFDVEWRGYFHIALALYTESLQPVNLANKETEPKFGGFYSLQINPFAANLLPVKQTDPLRYLGTATLQLMSQKSTAHIDVRANKSRRLVALIVDGVLVKQWVDTDDFAGTGTAIRFVHQGQGVVKISNIKVSEWDGQFEEIPTLTPNKTEDIAKLRNGDKVVGAVKSITDGKMSVNGAGTDLQIPISRVKQIEIAGEKTKTLTPYKSVRAYFTRGGYVTFVIEKITRDSITVANPAFGPATFNPAAFQRLLFDLTKAEQ